MALPAAGPGFDPKTGPLLLSLEGETSLNPVPQLPQQLSDRHSPLPAVRYFPVDSDHLPFLGWFEGLSFSPAQLRPGSLWVMGTNEQESPKASSFFSLLPIHPLALLPPGHGHILFPKLSDGHRQTCQGVSSTFLKTIPLEAVQ